MIVIVDTNIVFSGLLSPEGKISDLLLNSSENFNFYAPSFLLTELEKHQDKFLKISSLEIHELNFLKRFILKNITFIDLENISQKSWDSAKGLTMGIDIFDAPFVALALELNGSLWTGDKKLAAGLAGKGVKWILTTADVQFIRDKK